MTRPNAAAVLVILWAFGSAAAAQQPAPSSTPAPTLVRVDGRLQTAAGNARTGSVTLVVSLYAEQDDTTPLWSEQQVVTLDAAGGYTIYAGATLPDGVPQEFLTGPTRGRWLGVGEPGAAEQFRMMLVTVPCGPSARADTLAGKSASDFVLTQNFSDTVKAALKNDLTKSANGAGTNGTGPGASSLANYLQKCTANGSPCTLVDSVLYDDGAGRIGLGTQNPQERLDIVNPAGSTRMSIGGVLVGVSDAAVRLRTGSTKAGFLFGAEYNIDQGFDITPSTVPGGTAFSTPALVVLNSGSIGVATGVAPPARRFEVVGTGPTGSRSGNTCGSSDTSVKFRAGSAKCVPHGKYNVDNAFGSRLRQRRAGRLASRGDR